MAYDAEGTVYIPLAEFWEFVRKFHPSARDAEVAYGVPRVVEGDLVIDYAIGTEGHPETWATPPKAVTQWRDLKKKNGG